MIPFNYLNYSEFHNVSVHQISFSGDVLIFNNFCNTYKIYNWNDYKTFLISIEPANTKKLSDLNKWLYKKKLESVLK